MQPVFMYNKHYTHLVRKLLTLAMDDMSCGPISDLTESPEQHPSTAGIGDRLPRDEIGTHSVIEAPDGIITVSVVMTGGEGDCEGIAMEGGRDGGADAGAVGTDCCDAIASWSKHRTSSADARSTGV